MANPGIGLRLLIIIPAIATLLVIMLLVTDQIVNSEFFTPIFNELVLFVNKFSVFPN